MTMSKDNNATRNMDIHSATLQAADDPDMITVTV